MRLIKLVILCVLLLQFFHTPNLFAQKISIEELLAQHLNSIGSIKNRDSVKTRIIVSDVEFVLQSQNPINGKSIIASTNEGILYGISLESNNFRLDKFSYDGKKTHIGYITPGVRSILGAFILSYDDVLKEGLLGGTLSSAWAAFNIESRKAKLTYEGTEKINGEEIYVVEYSPKGGSDLRTKLYFDEKTFRHIRSEYTRTVAARIGSGGVDSSSRQVETRYRLVEDFSNFKKFGDLTLPSSYKITYTIGSGALDTKAEWKFKVTDVSFNQSLGDNAFDINAN